MVDRLRITESIELQHYVSLRVYLSALTIGSPTKSLKSIPTSFSIEACNLARSIQALYVSPFLSTLLNCLSSKALNSSTWDLAHLIHADIIDCGKQDWNINAVCLM